jgi:hypothetical protein
MSRFEGWQEHWETLLQRPNVVRDSEPLGRDVARWIKHHTLWMMYTGRPQ